MRRWKGVLINVATVGIGLFLLFLAVLDREDPAPFPAGTITDVDALLSQEITLTEAEMERLREWFIKELESDDNKAKKEDTCTKEN